jgi:hypothetical protein
MSQQSISAAQMKSVNISFQSHNLILNFESHKDWVDIYSFIRKIWNRSIDPRSCSIDFAIALCRSIACRMIDFSSTDEFRSIDYKVDRFALADYPTGRSNWTLEMIEIIIDVFSSLNRMFWICFQLRHENKTKHKSTTKDFKTY